MPIEYAKLSRLGLSNAQFFDREIRVLKNAYWFDEQAQNIGYGDLAVGQAETVADNLASNELVAFLPQHIFSMRRENHDKVNRKLIARQFALLIMPRVMYLPGRDCGYDTDEKLGELPTISPDSVHKIMGYRTV